MHPTQVYVPVAPGQLERALRLLKARAGPVMTEARDRAYFVSKGEARRRERAAARRRLLRRARAQAA